MEQNKDGRLDDFPENGDDISDSASPQKAKTSKRKIVRKLALLFCASIVSFLLAEFCLVMLGISFPLLYQTDEYCATRLKPNLNARYIEEGKSVVRTNSSGFRFPELGPKDPNTFRIAVVGDSFVEAIQVEDESTFCSLLDRKLNNDGNNVEVLNFGISGFGTAQQLELLKHYVLPWKPDLVILTLFSGNDIADNSQEINPDQLKPYYRLENGTLLLDQSFRDDPRFIRAKSTSTRTKAWLINQSRSLQLINKFYSTFRNRNSKAANVGIGLNPGVYSQPDANSDWEMAWTITESLILEFNRVCENADSKCIVVVASNPVQVHPDPEFRNQFINEHQLNDLFYPETRIEGFCKRHSIRQLSLSRKFLTQIQLNSEPIYLHGFPNTEMGRGHWNETGHRMASELIFEFLKESELIDRP